MRQYLIVAFASACLACLLLPTATNGAQHIQGITIEYVDRLVDISTQLTKITEKITVKNTGNNVVSAISYIVDPLLKANLAYLDASIEAASSKSTPRSLNAIRSQDRSDSQLNDELVYNIELDLPLANGQSTTVQVLSVFTHAIRPYPTEIRQQDKQLVMFASNVYTFLPYPSSKQMTRIKLASARVESFSRKPEPATKSASEIRYGPFENVPAKSRERIGIHYENNKPLLTVTTLTRWIEVSHWGNVAVEEHIEVVHSGAKIVGEWSRLDYQRGLSTPAAVDGYTTILPASASDVYYKDAVGNISTSHLRQSRNAVELELRPRFPLFGGWRTQYFTGYNLPSYEYLYHKGSQYALQIRFVDHIFDQQTIDHATVKVALPEGSTNIQVHIPFAVNRRPDEVHFTYLDTSGRPVVVLEKNNLVEQHIQNMQITYTFARTNIYKEPLYVVGAVGLLTLLVIIFTRFDFSLSSRKVADQRLRMTGYKDMLHELVQLRAAAQRQLLNAFDKYKNTKDNNGLQQIASKLKAELDQLHNEISEQKDQVREKVGDAVSEKVGDVLRFCRESGTQLEALAVQTERLLTGKVARKEYDFQEKSIIGKLAEYEERISNALHGV